MPSPGTNFNSHPREGGDDLLTVAYNRVANFNSHPREGGDTHNWESVYPIKDISILTPARGVTGWRTWKISTSHFNSHPREGGDLVILGAVTLVTFQFSPPRGG